MALLLVLIAKERRASDVPGSKALALSNREMWKVVGRCELRSPGPKLLFPHSPRLLLFLPAAAMLFAVVPGFDGLEHAVALGSRGPDRFVLLEANLVIAFTLAIVV